MRKFLYAMFALAIVLTYTGAAYALDLSGLLPSIPQDSTLGEILMWVIALNLGLSGISKALEKVKDKTKTDLDNRAYATLYKIVSKLQKLIDFASANIQHKEPPKGK